MHKTGSTHATQTVREPSENHQGTVRDARTTRRSRELAMLTDRGVDPKHASDWLTARGKSALTETALAGVEREAATAGISLADAVRIAAERGWRGFSASWLTNQSRPGRVGVEVANQQAVEEFVGASSNVIEGDFHHA